MVFWVQTSSVGRPHHGAGSDVRHQSQNQNDELNDVQLALVVRGYSEWLDFTTTEYYD